MSLIRLICFALSRWAGISLVIIPVVSHAVLYGSTDVIATPPVVQASDFPNASLGAFGSPSAIPGTPTPTNQTSVDPTNASVQSGGGGASGGAGGGPPGGAGGGPSIAGNTSAVAAILGTGKTKTPAEAAAAAALIIPDPQTDEDVKDFIIDKTLNDFPKIYCACPYSINHDGFECGVESAYYKPGNWRLRCYPQDIKGQEYIFYRKNL